MTKIAKVISLFYSTLNERISTTQLQLDARGVLKDKHYAKNIDRSVLITSLDSYRLVSSHGISVDNGMLGENLLIDYNPYSLPTGARLKVGTVILEISTNCTLCKSFAKIDARLPKLLKDDRGIFAKVTAVGSIKEEDDIYLLD